MDNHRAANAFLQLAHIGLLFLVIARRNGRLISFCASLLSFWLWTERRRSISVSRVAFLFQFSVFIGGFHQRQLGLLVADGVETIAQTLDFILFDFFHGDLIC